MAKELIPLAVQYKKPTLLMSGGGLVLDAKLMKQMLAGRTRFYVPSGAIAGIDGLLASKEAGLKQVTLTTSKSLRSLKGAPLFDKFPERAQLTQPKKIIFEGSVKQAIQYFPKNLNVSALLALAGLGPQKTKVRVIAYKRLAHNVHEMEVKSRAGKITLKTENFPHPQNPRTSALAIYSAQALLKKTVQSLIAWNVMRYIAYGM